jgi:putative endonuclease
MLVATYIIKCKDETFYTGITKHLAKRMVQHKKGMCRYTRYHGFDSCVYTYYSDGYLLARHLEVFIKRKGAKKFLYSQGVYL